MKIVGLAVAGGRRSKLTPIAGHWFYSHISWLFLFVSFLSFFFLSFCFQVASIKTRWIHMELLPFCTQWISGLHRVLFSEKPARHWATFFMTVRKFTSCKNSLQECFANCVVFDGRKPNGEVFSYPFLLSLVVQHQIATTLTHPVLLRKFMNRWRTVPFHLMSSRQLAFL